MCIFLSKWRFYCPECPHHFVFCYFSNKVIDWKLLPWQRHSLNEDGWATKNMSIDADFSAVHVAFQSFSFAAKSSSQRCALLRCTQYLPISSNSAKYSPLQNGQPALKTIARFANSGQHHQLFSKHNRSIPDPDKLVSHNFIWSKGRNPQKKYV